jgi:hypothetical protein
MTSSLHTRVAEMAKLAAVPSAPLLRKCACGQHTGGGECAECSKKQKESGNATSKTLQRFPNGVDSEARFGEHVPPIVLQVLHSSGRPLDSDTRAFFEPRFKHDFSGVRVHTNSHAAKSADAVGAIAYTVGDNIVFSSNQYSPRTSSGQSLLAHELTHVVQNSSRAGGDALPTEIGAADSHEEREAASIASGVMAGHAILPAPGGSSRVQRQASPYIKKVTVHLNPKQSADLEWEGTPPASAPGKDHFTVSTGKGYDDVGDPPGTCFRHCCKDAMTQCAPPFNQPDKVGACCTYFGSGFWTGTPEANHGGWLYWTPIQPYYSSRGIALHQHDQVTGDPIGHGCVRMEEDNAHRIADYSRGRKTAVVIDGRAAPVACSNERRCDPQPGKGASAEPAPGENGPDSRLAEASPVVPGLEGELT